MKHLLIPAALTAIMALSAPGAAETVLRYSSWLPTDHWLNTKAMQPWREDVARVTNGRVTVEQLPKTVGTPAAQFDVCRDGLADICVIVPGYTPGRFPIAEVGEMPFMGENPVSMSPAFDAYYREHFLQIGEMKGIHPLAFIKGSPGNIYTRADKPLKTLDDVKGLKMRSAGRITTEILELLGAVPVLKSSVEAYELLSTGVLDGSMMLTESVQSTNVTGLLKNALKVPGGMFSTTLVVVINQATWDRLSEEERVQITSVSEGLLSGYFGQAYHDADVGSLAAMEAAGYNVTMAEGAMLDTIRTALAPIDAAWIKRATQAGVQDAGQKLADLRKVLAE